MFSWVLVLRHTTGKHTIDKPVGLGRHAFSSSSEAIHLAPLLHCPLLRGLAHGSVSAVVFVAQQLHHHVLHSQPLGSFHEPVASNPPEIFLQQLPVSRTLGDARNHRLERHSSSFHHSCSKKGLSLSKSLSALKLGSHSWSHHTQKSYELKLLLSPLFHSLSAKQLENTTT